MKKTLIAFSLFPIVANAADVQSLKCERDMRPVDGNYGAVELVRNEANKYDVYYHIITAGFGSPVFESRVKIAQNLDRCTFGEGDARITSCYKMEREEGENTNTGFSSQKVARTAVTDGSGSLVTSEAIEITVYSPQLLANAKTPGFPHMESLGRFVTSFQSRGTNGIMLNRCEVK